MIKHTFCTILLSFVFLLGSCQKDSPEATAKEFLNSFYHMDFDKAVALSTPKQAELVKQIEQFSVVVNDSVRAERKKVTVEITNVIQTGDEAVVTFKNSLEPSEQTLKLVHKDGKWLANNSKEDITDDLDDEEVQESEVEKEKE